jgi:hypothetical protein
MQGKISAARMADSSGRQVENHVRKKLLIGNSAS